MALLAYNVLTLIGRCVEQTHPRPSGPAHGVSLFHLVLQIRSGDEGLRIALPPEYATACGGTDPPALAERLMSLARRIDPKTVATNPREPKTRITKSYLPAKEARAHLATARDIAKTTPRKEWI